MQKEKFSALGETAVTFAIFFTIYVLTICGVTAMAHDSMFYIIRIATGLHLSYKFNPLYHPHHLIYNALARAWVILFRSLGIKAEAAFLVSLLNAFFGALTLCVFYWILRKRLNMKQLPALLGTALPAFSFGFWFYSVCVELCIPPLLFLTLAIYLLTAERISEKTFALVGLLNGIAILFHQSHILFVPVIVWTAYLKYKQEKLPFWKSGAYFTATFFISVAIPHFIVIFGVLKLRSVKKIARWLTHYLHRPIYWNTLAPSTFAKAIIGFSRAIIGLYFSFAIPTITKLINKVCKGNWLMDETFLVRHLNKNLAYLLLFLLVILFIILCYNIFTRFQNRRLIQQKERNFISIIAAWLIPYSAFFFFWVANNAELWIPQTMCVWLILLTVWPYNKTGNSQFSTGKAINLSVIALLLFILNYAGSIHFLKDKHNDFYYNKAAPVADMAKKNDLIIIGPSQRVPGKATNSWNSWTFHSYLLQYTKANVWSLIPMEYDYVIEPVSPRIIQRMQKIIEKTLANGNRVFIYKEAIDINPNYIKYFKKVNTMLDNLWQTYQPTWKKMDFDTNTIYIIKNPINTE